MGGVTDINQHTHTSAIDGMNRKGCSIMDGAWMDACMHGWMN